MRRSLLIGTGFTLLFVLIGVLDSTLLHPLPLPASVPIAQQQETRDAGKGRQRVLDIVTALQFTTQESSEDTLLRQLAADETAVHALVLLAENDRSALLAWTESPDAGTYFSALKEALSASFSTDLKDLRDDRELLPGGRSRDILSFHDKALSAERITIVHAENALYEFHIAYGQEERIGALIEALTTD